MDVMTEWVAKVFILVTLISQVGCLIMFVILSLLNSNWRSPVDSSVIPFGDLLGPRAIPKRIKRAGHPASRSLVSSGRSPDGQ